MLVGCQVNTGFLIFILKLGDLHCPQRGTKFDLSQLRDKLGLQTIQFYNNAKTPIQ